MPKFAKAVTVVTGEDGYIKQTIVTLENGNVVKVDGQAHVTVDPEQTEPARIA